MKTSEILIEIAKCKQDENYERFKELFNSLDLIELTELPELHVFAIELKNSCENLISKSLK
jgi:hypothetical protein